MDIVLSSSLVNLNLLVVYFRKMYEFSNKARDKFKKLSTYVN